MLKLLHSLSALRHDILSDDALAAQFAAILGFAQIFPVLTGSGGSGPSGSGLLLEGAGTNYLLAENGNYLIQEG